MQMAFLRQGPVRHWRPDLPFVMPVLLEEDSAFVEDDVDHPPRLIGNSMCHCVEMLLDGERAIHPQSPSVSSIAAGVGRCKHRTSAEAEAPCGTTIPPADP